MNQNWIDPAPLRRIMFTSDEEWAASRETIDALLSWCWTAQHDFLDRLPPTREREIATQKLEEFACYARLAIIAARADKEAGEGKVAPGAQGEAA